MYIVIRENEPVVFQTEEQMKEAGYEKADMEITQEQSVQLIRVINGEIVFGYTDEEKKETARKERINLLKKQIADSDYKVIKAYRLKKDVEELYPGITKEYIAMIEEIHGLEK